MRILLTTQRFLGTLQEPEADGTGELGRNRCAIEGGHCEERCLTCGVLRKTTCINAKSDRDKTPSRTLTVTLLGIRHGKMGKREHDTFNDTQILKRHALPQSTSPLRPQILEIFNDRNTIPSILHKYFSHTVELFRPSLRRPLPCCTAFASPSPSVRPHRTEHPVGGTLLESGRKGLVVQHLLIRVPRDPSSPPPPAAGASTVCLR